MFEVNANKEAIRLMIQILLSFSILLDVFKEMLHKYPGTSWQPMRYWKFQTSLLGVKLKP